jgi:hypothetical protein
MNDEVRSLKQNNFLASVYFFKQKTLVFLFWNVSTGIVTAPRKRRGTSINYCRILIPLRDFNKKTIKYLRNLW